ncbi:class I SAM-dependent methyltransferase [Salinifilum ghardaiensis]
MTWDERHEGVGARLLRRSFGRPSGLLGRVGGWVMARGNAATERHVVELADLRPEEVVVVLGPGPGLGVQAAAQWSGHVIGIDPSGVMLASCARRCAGLIDRGRVRLRRGTADSTGQPSGSVDVVLAVNTVQLWPDWDAALAELHRILTPGARLLLSAHRRWLPGGLAAHVERAGFDDIRTWRWDPPGRGAATAVQLRARRAEHA